VKTYVEGKSRSMISGPLFLFDGPAQNATLVLRNGRTQRRNADPLNHQLRPIAKEADRQSIAFTQSKHLRAEI